MTKESPICEVVEFDELPPLHDFCCIQFKDGEKCLRVPDQVMVTKDRKFRVQGEWHRPGSEPWNPDFYPT